MTIRFNCCHSSHIIIRICFETVTLRFYNYNTFWNYMTKLGMNSNGKIMIDGRIYFYTIVFRVYCIIFQFNCRICRNEKWFYNKKTHIILIQLQERYNLIYFVIRYEKFYITIFKRIRFLAIFIHYLYWYRIKRKCWKKIRINL